MALYLVGCITPKLYLFAFETVNRNVEPYGECEEYVESLHIPDSTYLDSKCKSRSLLTY